MKTRATFRALFAYLLFCTFPLSAQVIYVDNHGTGDGSPDNPSSIQDAFTNMVDGTIMRLDTGEYVIEHRLLVTQDIIIEGGYDMSRNWIKTSDVNGTVIHRTNANVSSPHAGDARISAFEATNRAYFHLSNLSIVVDPAPIASSFGVSTYGVWLATVVDFTIARVNINVGNASDGATGPDGADGLDGANGSDTNSNFPYNGGAGAAGTSSLGTVIPGGTGANQGSVSHKESIDVSQLSGGGAFGLGSRWQSFTPTVSGYLSKLYTYAKAVNPTYNIYDGEGVGGTLLYSQATSINQPSSFDKDSIVIDQAIYLTAGQKYTWSCTNCDPLYTSSNPYAGGRSNTSSTGDNKFETAMMQQADNGGDGGAIVGDYRAGGAGGGGGGRTNNTLLAVAGAGGQGSSSAIPFVGAGGVLNYPYAVISQSDVNGSNGSLGWHGIAGSQGTSTLGSLYMAGQGTQGQHGSGGSGGGGGSGGIDGITFTKAGAGGGAGGEGGEGGFGGYGGGGSFGIYASNCGAASKIVDCNITVGIPGVGGDGGDGGQGGTGGQGGEVEGSANIAGNGGNGGTGGNAGIGGQGSDGIARNVVLFNSPINSPIDSVAAHILTDPVIAIENLHSTQRVYTYESANPVDWDFGNDGSIEEAGQSRIQHVINTTGITDLKVGAVEYAEFVHIYNDLSCPGGAVIYVDKDASGANNGSSWTDAYVSIQAAIDMADICGATDIYVKEGVYYPERMSELSSGAFQTFYIDNDIRIYGGFLGTESNPEQRPMIDGYPDPAHYTVLSGDIQQNDEINAQGVTEKESKLFIDTLLAYDNVYHVVTMEGLSNAAVFDGFIVTAGYSNNLSGHGNKGGGLYNIGDVTPSNPMIANCIFQGNVAAFWGGGVLNWGNTQPTFTRCEFINNASYSDGGAFYNMADSSQIGLPELFNSSPTIRKCRFAGNYAVYNAAGLYNNGASGNESSPQIIECVFSGNFAGSTSAFIFDGSNSNPLVLNCTFSGNKPILMGQFNNANVRIYNSILYGNELPNGSQFFGNLANYDIRNSIVEGIASGINVQDIDPQFVNPIPYTDPVPNTLGDYRLSNCSPVLDYGDNALYQQFVNDSLDYANAPRFTEGRLSPINQDPSLLDIDPGPFEVNDGPLMFSASKDSTDAYIDLSWSVDKNKCDCLDEDVISEQGVSVQLKSGNTLIEAWTVYKEDIDSIYAFNYRDYVGPDVDKDYYIEFKRQGPGTLNCRQVASGSTLPFIEPEIFFINDEDVPHQVRIRWRNKSYLTSGYTLYRDGLEISEHDKDAVIDEQFFDDDFFAFDDATSLVNGASYNYCLETRSDLYENIHGSIIPTQACAVGSTASINLQASDNAHPTQVDLTWNDMSDFSSKILIKRDGELIGGVAKDVTSYTDLMPIPGKQSIYSVELVNNGDLQFVGETGPYVASYDQGSIVGNGEIGARVLSAGQKIPISGVDINISWTVDDSLHSMDFVTDHDGAFGVGPIYYGESSDITITANYGSNNFIDNPIVVTIDLVNPISFTNFIYYDTLFEEALAHLDIISNFDPSPIPDAMIVDWTYNKPNTTDTILFNIYRDSELIIATTDNDPSTGVKGYALPDYTGVPGAEYVYTLHALQRVGGEVIDTTLSATRTYPEVSVVGTFNATPNLAEGSVDLSWAHNSDNFTGFRLYRDNGTPTLIYEGTDLAFADLGGLPGQSTDYYVTAYRSLNNVDYESLPSTVITVTYPVLAPLTGLTLTPVSAQDRMAISFDVPASYTADYNYDGVKIYRNDGVADQPIGIINRTLLSAGASFQFDDFSGVPNAPYTYTVYAYKEDLGIETLSSGTSAAANFPPVSPAVGIFANVSPNRVELNWGSPHSSDNYDGFIIYKSSEVDSLGSIPFRFQNQWVDYGTPNQVTEIYSVRTVRWVNGQRYLSVPVDLLVTTQTGLESPYLHDLVATRNIPDHVKLCWTWNDPATQAIFVIRREGVVIDSIPFTSMEYYDYGAPQGRDLEYSIESVVPAQNLPWTYVTGMAPNLRSISGRIYKRDSHEGIANVPVSLRLSEAGVNTPFYLGRATSDASGFYRIDNLPPNPSGLDIDVKVEAVSTAYAFEQNPQTFTVPEMDSVSMLTVDFVDTTAVDAGDAIAEVISAVATPNPSFMSIDLSWSTDNSNYDGFEIFSGSELLGEVFAGSPLVYQDESGIAGIQSLYSVRAYKFGEFGKEYTEYAVAAAIFPRLEPVQYLTATKMPGQNRIMIQWSHPYDNHDLYTITRNGVPFHVVNTGEQLMAIDSTGIPDKAYTYEVIARKGLMESLPVSVGIDYASTESIKSFTISAPSHAYLPGQSQNHLLLEWDYEANTADSFMIMRYIKTGPDKSDERVLSRVSGNNRSYKDYTGTPNQLYHYEVLPILVRNGQEYGPRRRDAWSESEIFPLLSSPKIFVQSIAVKGNVRIVNFYDYPGADGFELYRDNDLIYTKEYGEFAAPYLEDLYTDEEGIPNTYYDYKSRAYTIRGGNVYYSAYNIVSVTYPNVPTPQNLAATDGSFANQINLTWDYDTDIPVESFVIERNIDGFGWESVATVTAGERTYTDYNGYAEGIDYYLPIDYRVKAVNMNISSAWDIDTGHLYYGAFTDGGLVDLGRSIDMDGDWAAAGCVDGVVIYHKQPNNVWVESQRILAPFGDVVVKDNFGVSVAMSDKFLAVGASYKNQKRGAVYIFSRNNAGDYEFEEKIVNNSGRYFGHILDIDKGTGLGSKDFLAIGARDCIYCSDHFRMYRRNADGWGNFLETIYPNMRAKEVVLDGNRLLTFANQRLEMYSHSNTWNLTAQRIFNFLADIDVSEDVLFAVTNNSNTSHFIDLNNPLNDASNGLSTTQDGHTAGALDGNNAGILKFGNQFHQFVKSNGSWSTNGQRTLDENYARMEMHEEDVFLANPQNSKVRFITLNDVPKPLNVAATDGSQPGQVTITWDPPSSGNAGIDGYNIYRDGEFLVNKSTGEGRNHVDLPSAGLVPGDISLYQVEATNGNSSSTPVGDSGFMPPNGSISGQLTTLQGGAPIENGQITATLMVDGDYITYETTTDLLGQYTINDIYYSTSSEVEIRCSYIDHEIISQESAGLDEPLDVITITLDINNNSYSTANFFDKTAYAITGTVQHKDTPNCFTDSVKVQRTYVINQGGNEVRYTDDKYTDAEGNYTFIIEPELSGLDSIIIEVNDTVFMAGDTLIKNYRAITDHVYVDNSDPYGFQSITDFNVDRITRIDFQDQTFYDATIYVINTCGTVLSQGDTWTIRVNSTDGCFEAFYETNANNVLNVPVPPLDLVFTVTDVSDKSIQNLVYLDKLSSSPGLIDVNSLHRDSARHYNSTQIIEAMTLNLEYHKPPMITASYGPSFEYMCDDPTLEAIVTQSEDYKIDFDVTEAFDPVCSVSSGYLRIVNAASNATEADTIYFDEALMGFPSYEFTAGSPNPVIPHTWLLSVEYYSDAGIFQGAYSKPIIVEGSVNLPGNGIITDPALGDNIVPLPLYVLRDPPGDKSFASIESGTEVTKTFTFDSAQGGSIGAYGSVAIEAVGIGAEAGMSINASLYNYETSEYTISTVLTERIQTEGGEPLDPGDKPEAVGRTASIVVGAGIAMQYGIVNSYEVSDCGEITETRSVGLTPVEVKTTWTYTIGFIEDLIAGYERDIELIENDQLVLKDSNNNDIPKDEAINKYQSLKTNWEQVIHYFDVETNPIYAMTQNDYSDEATYGFKFKLGSVIAESLLNEEADKWRLALQSELAITDVEDIKSLVFTQQQLDRYNNTAVAIRGLLDAHRKAAGISNSSVINTLLSNAFDTYSFDQNKFTSPNYFTQFGIPANDMAENRTFSGGTSQTFTRFESSSFTKSNTLSTSLESSAYAQLGLSQDVVIFAGLGAGVINKVLEVSGVAGGSISTSYTQSETVTDATSSSTKVQYTLSDGDPQDEISVSVLTGIAMNHTPYFQMVGGKTSCPYEEGTLTKDDPKIQVLDPATGAPGKTGSQFFLDPNEPAVFTVNIANLSNSLDTRDVEVFLDNNSNPNGAIVKLAGANLGSQTFTELAYNTPLTMALTVERGVGYEFENLRIGVRAPCGTDDVVDYITVNVKFQSPCSPVTIVKPSNGWQINSSSRDLVIGLRDYVPSTPNFEGLTLEYRRTNETTGFFSGWTQIPFTSIKETGDNNNPVSPQVLADYNAANFGPGEVPTYFMVWEPDMGNSALFPDGSYELRVVSKCKEGPITTNTFSNVVSGIIDRSRLQLFGTPQPADGVWVAGDEVSISFNKDINCIPLLDPGFVADYLGAYIQDTLVHNATFTCFNNKIIMTVPDMSIYDGEIMTVRVDSITDENGNLAYEIDEFGNTQRLYEWDFLITTSKAYWEQDSIVATIYEGEELTLTAGLRNVDLQAQLSGLGLMRTTASAPWLGIDPSTTFDINPGAVRPITLTLTGAAIGVTYDTLSVTGLPGSGLVPTLPIKLTTLKRPPYPPNWTVDGNQFPSSMTLVTNYKLGADGAISTDTMDQITVWVRDTLRGLGRITEVSPDQYVSYITVYGSSADDGEELEFRVWDASTDTEYDAHAEIDTIYYADGSFVGTTGDPRLLLVDTLVDRARYIHLNQGYTWVTLNSVVEDMSIAHIMRDVQTASPEDRILGQRGFAEYINDTIGWFANPITGIDSFHTDQTYMIYLANGPDSIRMTGIDAPQYTEFLVEGTNWIGFPSQTAMTVENAIGVNNLSDVEQIRGKDDARLSDGSNWTSGTLTNMEPNQGYKLSLSNLKAVTIPGAGNATGSDGNMAGRMMMADPNDHTTWDIDLSDFAYDDVVPMIGRIVSNGAAIQDDGQKQVAAFINGELRGHSYIENLAQLNDNLFSLFIGVNSAESAATVTIYYYNGTEVSDSLTVTVADLLENSTGRYTYSDPYIWELCKDHLVLDQDDSPLSGVYRAAMSITIQDNVVVLPGQSVEFSAPLVKLNTTLTTQTGANITISPDGCN